MGPHVSALEDVVVSAAAVLMRRYSSQTSSSILVVGHSFSAADCSPYSLLLSTLIPSSPRLAVTKLVDVFALFALPIAYRSWPGHGRNACCHSRRAWHPGKLGCSDRRHNGTTILTAETTRQRRPSRCSGLAEAAPTGPRADAGDLSRARTAGKVLQRIH